MSSPAASHAPTTVGDVGYSSEIRVGREESSLASHRKSSKAECTFRVKLRFPLDVCRRVSCSKDNSPRDPGMAIVIDLRSPSTLCHKASGAIRRLRWISVRILSSRLRRRYVNSMVPLTVSIIHPKTALRVVQVPSPLLSFFTDAGSCRCRLSVSSSGRKTLSSA